MPGIQPSAITGVWSTLDPGDKRRDDKCCSNDMANTPPSPERIARYRRGRFSELAAAALLMAKGYRILGRRVRTPYGEIDLVAVRGKRLAFVEVKRRASRLECEAALSPRQAGRIARAAEFWISRNMRYRDHDRGLDAIFVMPGRLPVHVPDALNLGPSVPRVPR